MIKYLICLGILIFNSYLLKSQQVKDYIFKGSLEQCLDYALVNNRSLYNSKLDLDIIRKSFWEGVSLYFPKLNSQVSYTNNLITQRSLVPASAFDQVKTVINTMKDYYEMDPKKEYVPASGYIPISFSTKHNVNSNINLSQLILDFEAIWAIDLAVLYENLQNNIHFKNKANTIAQVTSSYAQILIVENKTEILINNKKILDQTLVEGDNRYKLGLIDKESLDKIRIKIYQLEKQIKGSFREEQYHKRILKFTMGLDIDSKIELTDDIDKLIEYIKKDMIYLFNVENTTDYLISKSNKDISYKQIDIKMAKFIPKLELDLSIGASLSGDEIDVFGFKKDDWLSYSSLVFKLKIPIFNAKNIYVFQKSKIDYDKAVVKHEIVEQELKLNWQNTYDNLLTALDVFSISKRSFKLAQEVLSKEQIKFSNGITSSSELLQVQNDLYSAQQDYILSIFNIFKYKVELDKIIKR